MALVQATLASQLANLSPTDNEASAITTITNAYITFMSTAGAGPIPIIPLGLQSTPKLAMMGALTGLSSDGQGAQKLQDGITAFWAAMIPLAATLFPTAILIVPPPTLSTIASLLTPIFIANTQGSLDLVSCANNVATILYTSSIGGLATIVVPPPTVVPIL